MSRMLQGIIISEAVLLANPNRSISISSFRGGIVSTITFAPVSLDVAHIVNVNTKGPRSYKRLCSLGMPDAADSPSEFVLDLIDNAVRTGRDRLF